MKIMSTDILVVTPNTELGDTIRGMLPPGRFTLHITPDFSQAIRLVRQTGCSLALLDSALEEIDISMLDVAYALKQLNGDIQIAVLVGDAPPADLARLAPRAVLPQPLQAEVLLAFVEQVFPPQPEPASDAHPSHDEGMPWLNDVRRAAQHLTRLTLESSAQAALITNNNALWAYAGQLSQAAANELSQMVQRYWDWRGDSDLLRFVRLAATEQAHMLYATRLSTTLTLALVFDGETPFSTIRSQAGRLAASLSSAPDSAEEKPGTGPHVLNDTGPNDLRNHPHINTLLNDVPPPIPEARKVERKPAEPEIAPFSAPPQDPAPAAMHISRSSVDASPSRLLVEQAQPAVDAPADSQPLDETRRSAVPDDLAATRKQAVAPPVPDPQSLAETQAQAPRVEPGQNAEDNSVQRLVLESDSAALYNLNFACLLIPRFESHHLVGDLADRLGVWVPKLCIAFGWRLEYISIRPAYLQWVVNVPPASSPNAVIKKIREHTSVRIFQEFPRFRVDNVSDDFWAPGYLIMGGSQPHPPKFAGILSNRSASARASAEYNPPGIWRTGFTSSQEPPCLPHCTS
jgi:REP element-mobilizing transposase RayT/DNA-binding response OmpR family regulator